MITGSWLVWQHMDTLDGLIFKMIQNSLLSMNRSEPWQQNKVFLQVIYSALSQVETALGPDPYFHGPIVIVRNFCRLEIATSRYLVMNSDGWYFTR